MRVGIAILAACIGLGCTPSLRADPWVKNYGLGNIFHPMQDPGPIPFPSCYNDGQTQCCKDHVYIFGINGANPFCSGNFNGLLKYFRDNGFEKTYFGQVTATWDFRKRIRGIRQSDPDAKIVVIGFSIGANFVKCMVNKLNEEGVRIDLLVYLVGDYIFDTPGSFPPNVCKVVNIRGNGLIFLAGMVDGADITGASNYNWKCRHILAPSRKETLTVLMTELLLLACFPSSCAPAMPAIPSPAPVMPPPVPAAVSAPPEKAPKLTPIKTVPLLLAPPISVLPANVDAQLAEPPIVIPDIVIPVSGYVFTEPPKVTTIAVPDRPMVNLPIFPPEFPSKK